MDRGFEDAASCWKAIMSDVHKNRGLLSVIEKFARENTNPANIVFGTSGWRGEIGSDFTFNNVRIVTSAIIEMFKGNDSSVMQAMGVSGFKEIIKRGVIVGHDNRFLGPDFAGEVIGLLQKEGEISDRIMSDIRRGGKESLVLQPVKAESIEKIDLTSLYI